MKATRLLKRIEPADVARLVRPPVDETTLAAAGEIVDDVRARGAAAVRDYAGRFGERAPDASLVLGPADMSAARAALDVDDRAALERAAARIERFARAQRASIGAVTIPIPGGEAGHTVEPVASVGCYAPGGRYPLPSSVLMTAIPARVAGCGRVVVASPGAHPAALAAASIAGADAFLAVGGAHAVAALAFGIQGFDRCDLIAGPGNRWVTAAKRIVSGTVGIDMLAGPSELLVLADDTGDPELIAADLLAQAEHDVDAVPMLVTTSAALADAVDAALARQLDDLPTRDVAAGALPAGFACVADDLDGCLTVIDGLAPEHLEIMTRDATAVAARVRNAGAIFIGPRSAEVFGDYGAGPNHTLPTGGTARFQAGLSVMSFLRLRTWMRLNDPAVLLADTDRLARLEKLAGHAASARARVVTGSTARVDA